MVNQLQCNALIQQRGIVAIPKSTDKDFRNSFKRSFRESSFFCNII